MFQECLTNLDRKAHLSLEPTASLALSPLSWHPTPSVFQPDQRGMHGFLIRTLGPELWGHPHPNGEPQWQQGQGLISEHGS